jgi:fluoride exporter
LSLLTCLFVMLGGALGSLFRYVLAVLFANDVHELPIGTIGINVSGSFLIGFFGTLTLANGRFPVSENVRLFVMVGLCGGYTTFSSFSLQTLDLMRSGAIGRAAINVVASVVLCVFAVGLGHLAAAHFNGGAIEIAQIDIEEEA